MSSSAARALPRCRLVVAALLALALADSLAAFAPVATLSREDAALVRRAAAESAAAQADDPLDAVAAWLRAAPGWPAAEAEALADRVLTDATLRRALLELITSRAGLRHAPRGRFECWWDPGQDDAQGEPSAGLSDEDAAELSGLVESLALELGLPAPDGVPYTLDLTASVPRVRGPAQVRWGIVTASPRDRAAVIRLLLLEAGDAPFVVDAFARLRACPDRDCRRALLDAARASVMRSGYVPILEGLRAAAFAGDDDPAFASALLAVDRIDRLHPARTFTSLLRELAAAGPDAPLQGVFFRATGEPPGRLDKLIQAEIGEWARARAAPPAGRPERPPRGRP